MSVAATILQQIGVMSRGCLDIKGNKCYQVDNGVRIVNCLVQTAPNRRGNITILLNDKDLYDVIFVNKKNQVVHYEDLYADNLHEMFGEVSGSLPQGSWSKGHVFKG